MRTSAARAFNLLTNLVSTNFSLGPLAQYDTNGDDTITTNEFVAAEAALVLQLQTNFLAKYDGNGDGTVTSAELVAATQAAATQWLTNVLARADRNGDGTLSTNEFRGGRGGPEGPLLAELNTGGLRRFSEAAQKEFSTLILALPRKPSYRKGMKWPVSRSRLRDQPRSSPLMFWPPRFRSCP